MRPFGSKHSSLILANSWSKNRPSLVVCLTHFLHLIRTVSQAFNGCILAVGRRTHNCKLMHLDHLLDDHLRSAGIAKSPSGHRKSFGKSIDHDGSLFHPRQTCDGHMSPFDRSAQNKFHQKAHTDHGLPTNFAIGSRSSLVIMDPVGLFGKGMTRIFVFRCDLIFQIFHRQFKLIFILSAGITTGTPSAITAQGR